ncbi:hypothetical protein CUJ83_01705 [Methanocella sp. CWC-04]|uniref:Uncharacterized protein n=1 Tax=Methanooceanicella nereidis TaxID=2052831 RepID=A0AAP2RCU8_9EURY|nr:hypothetical protein [Methanocella sp. CWC-04]MCD1293710.1 hypothetical protein [Methanocella sp. CWC-04]
MDRSPPQLEHIYITSLENYLSLLKSEKVRDCYSGLQLLSKKEKFQDKKIVVRSNVAEQIREKYKVSKRAFYGANRDVEFTSQTTLDVDGPGQ